MSDDQIIKAFQSAATEICKERRSPVEVIDILRIHVEPVVESLLRLSRQASTREVGS